MNINKNQAIVWAVDAVFNAVKNASNSLYALFGASAFNVVHVPWGTDVGIAAGAGVLTLVSSLKSLPMLSLDSKGNVDLVADESTVIAEAPSAPAVPAVK